MVSGRFRHGVRRLLGTHSSNYVPGKGSSVQFLNTKKKNRNISTEGELIGGDYAMSRILWSRHFIEAQGYNIADNRLIQDSKISILLKIQGFPAPI